MIVDLLSEAALIHASSPKIFERGKTYASSGAVSIVGEVGDPEPAIQAEVAGTQIYKARPCYRDERAERIRKLMLALIAHVRLNCYH
jgi:uncharacterized Zn finger protein